MFAHVSSLVNFVENTYCVDLVRWPRNVYPSPYRCKDAVMNPKYSPVNVLSNRGKYFVMFGQHLNLVEKRSRYFEEKYRYHGIKNMGCSCIILPYATVQL